MADPWKRDSPGCECCGSTVCGTICVTVNSPCGGGVGAGALVTVKQGATVVGTCTTDASSACCVDIPAAGNYSYFADPPAGQPGLTRSTTTTFAATCTANNRTATLGLAAAYSCPGSCSHNPMPQASDLEVDDNVLGNTPYAPATFYPWSKIWNWPGCAPTCVGPISIETAYRFNCDNAAVPLIGVLYSTFNGVCPNSGGALSHENEFFLAKTSETSGPWSMTFGGAFLDSGGNPLASTTEQYKIATQLYCGTPPVVTLS